MISEKDKIKHLYNRAAVGLTIDDFSNKNNFKQANNNLCKTQKYKI